MARPWIPLSAWPRATAEKVLYVVAWPLLSEAEQLYRCCLDPKDPHYARTLFGLANCLFLKSDTPGAEDLREAIKHYDECLRSAGDAELTAAALVGFGGIGEAVAEHPRTCGERGQDHFVHMLSARPEHQRQLRPRR